MSAPTNAPETSLLTAESAIQQALAVIKAYGESAHLSLKAGTALQDVSAQITQASEYVQELGTRLKEAKTFGDVPVDVVGGLASRSLAALATATEHAAEFDTKYALSQKLYGKLEDAVGNAKNSLQELQSRVGSVVPAVSDASAAAVQGVAATVSGAATAMSAQVPVQHAHAALSELVQRLQTALPSESVKVQEALAAARGLVATATDRVGSSIEHLTQAPLTEKPVVAALEALHLATAALTSMTAAMNAAYEGLGVHAALSLARDRAGAAVGEATTQLTALRQQLASGVVHAATAGVAYAVRTAATLDTTYSITDRVKALDDSYHVSDKLKAATATAQALASNIDRDYHVSERALGVIEKAKELDASITGGRATSLTTSAVSMGASLATTAVEYAKTVVQQFEEAKEHVTTTAGASPTEAQALAEAGPVVSPSAPPAHQVVA